MKAASIHPDGFRPAYHFTPPSHWMNDPNGMVYFEGEYHLFYQHHPYGTTWGPMHWGHAVSTDLVSWEHLPIALEPDEYGAIFSGSAVVDGRDSSGFFGGRPGFVAIFTHHDTVPGTDRVRQRQSLAYSADSGRSWTKYAGNPVLENERFADFRDPKVFRHEPSGEWVMILASGQTVCIYRSSDLKNWKFASEFGEGVGSHDGVWECPDLFPLSVDGDASNVKWVLLVSIGDSPSLPEGSRTQFFTGSFDGYAFVGDEASSQARWLDYGRDNYAGVSWSDIPERDGRRIYIGWMSNWKYANLTPTEGWRGAMTLPRQVLLETGPEGGIRLVQRPVVELEKLRWPVLKLKDASGEETKKRLSELRMASYEMAIEIGFAGLKLFGLKVRVSPEQETVIGYDPDSKELFVDRTRAGRSDFHPEFAGRHGVGLEGIDGLLRLRIFVDRCSVEVFADDGRAALTDLIFPDPDALGMDIFGLETGGTVRSLEVYLLERAP